MNPTAEAFASDLVTVACEAYACLHPTGPVARCGLVPGVNIADDANCAPQITANVERLFLTATFPDESASVDPALASAAVEVRLRYLICVPGLTPNGGAPMAQALYDATTALVGDATALWRAVAEAAVLSLDGDPTRVVVGPLLAFGSEGRRAGYEFLIVGNLGNFCPGSPCEEEVP